MPKDFFVVSERRFIILSILTFGGYTTYWFIKNWKLIKQQENSNIHPVFRGTIGRIFYIYPLTKKVLESAEARGYKKPSYWPKWTECVWGILWYRPVLEAIIFNNNLSQNKVENFDKFTTGEIKMIVLSGMVWILVLLGLVYGSIA